MLSPTGLRQGGSQFVVRMVSLLLAFHFTATATYLSRVGWMKEEVVGMGSYSYVLVQSMLTVLGVIAGNLVTSLPG